MMFNDEIYNNGGRPYFDFGEMAGFKIVPYIATHVKMIFFFFFFFYGAMKKNSANQNSPICIKKKKKKKKKKTPNDTV